ncbi:hypothetical protein BBP40_007731 [Aspergillus hancockii]|nr:hypothetical protein BBP40_007731 [Aspergillus hancockii]
MKAIYNLSILVLFASLSNAAPAASPNSANKQSSDDYSNDPEPLNWIKREEQQAEPLNWIKREDSEQAEPLNWI